MRDSIDCFMADLLGGATCSHNHHASMKSHLQPAQSHAQRRKHSTALMKTSESAQTHLVVWALVEALWHLIQALVDDAQRLPHLLQPHLQGQQQQQLRIARPVQQGAACCPRTRYRS